MIVYLVTIRGTRTGRYKVRAETESGDMIGQALDADQSAAEKRAKRQAYRWAEDRNIERLTFKKREATP